MRISMLGASAAISLAVARIAHAVTDIPADLSGSDSNAGKDQNLDQEKSFHT
jgi:hypothetical protein